MVFCHAVSGISFFSTNLQDRHHSGYLKNMKNRHIYPYPNCEEEQNMIKSWDSLVNDFE